MKMQKSRQLQRKEEEQRQAAQAPQARWLCREEAKHLGAFTPFQLLAAPPPINPETQRHFSGRLLNKQTRRSVAHSFTPRHMPEPCDKQEEEDKEKEEDEEWGLCGDGGACGRGGAVRRRRTHEAIEEVMEEHKKEKVVGVKPKEEVVDEEDEEKEI